MEFHAFVVDEDRGFMNFNKDWKFLLGNPKNAHAEDFCDRTWKQVDLPHDWVINMPFSSDGSYKIMPGWTGQNMQGFFAWEGQCWYRKEFNIDGLVGKAVLIYFGGAYRNSRVL